MTDAAQILRSPGRHLVAGKLTAPTASTAGKGWRGVMLELFPSGSSDFTAIFDNPGIALYLNGCVDLYQRFEGKCAHTVMRPGNVILSPPGIPKRFQYEATAIAWSCTSHLRSSCRSPRPRPAAIPAKSRS